MTVFEAGVLGVVQGLTEFLPISSTAHLRVVPALLGWQDPGAAFSAVLQLGSLLAVVAYFLKDLVRMGAAVLSPAGRRSPDARLLVGLVVGTLPIGVAGILFRHAIEGPLRSLAVIGASLIAVGLALAWVERRARGSRTIEDTRVRDCALVGLGQALALVPGVSRSGITLLVAMAIGLGRESAARLSFLLSVPAVAGAGLFQLGDVLRAPDLPTPALLAGLGAAAVSGFASIAWLLRFLRTRTTMPFVVYRVAAGAIVLLLSITGLAS